MPRIAIINDYQKLAAEAADWSSLPADYAVDISHDRLDDPELAAARLAPYEIVVTSREETRFDRELVARLPKLKLLITHGMRNAALDFDALREHGVIVMRQRLRLHDGHRRACLGLDPLTGQEHPCRGRRNTQRRVWSIPARRAHRQDA